MNASLTHADVITPPGSQRNLSAWIVLAALLSFAALATPFFMGRVYVADDLGEFHLPLRNFYAQQLSQGEPFEWTSELYGGFYVTAEGQLGAYHPLHLALYRWLPLGAAFNLELLLSYPLMFAGMYALLKRWLRREAALFGALVFTFCGFNLLHFVHPNAVAVVAHIPWLLFAIEVALTSNDPRQRAWAELGVGILTASQLLLGYPQYVWFSLLTEASYTVWRGVAVQATWRIYASLLTAKLFGALTGAVQLLPTMDALSNSVRQTGDAALANSGSLPPLNLIQLLAPYLFQTRVVGQNTHELGLYAGAVPCMLCVWLLAHRRDWGRFAPLAKAAITFAVLAFLLACGEFGGLYRLQSLLPFVDRFRFPCRAIVLVQLSIAVCAAIAIAILLQKDKSDGGAVSQHGNPPLLIAFLVSAALAVGGPLAWPSYVADAKLIWCGPLLIGCAGLLIALVQRGARGALTALVLFTAVDLSCYGLSYSVYGGTADLNTFVSHISLPPDRARGRIVAPHEPGGLRTGDRMLLAGLERIDGYAGLEPRKHLDYKTLPAQRLAGASWMYQPNNDSDHHVPRWTAIEPTAERARLVTETVPVDRLRDPATIPPTAAATGEPMDLSPGTSGLVTVSGDKPGRITLSTSAAGRQLLVTTESFHSGWRAVIDGVEGPVVRVNGDFLGCMLEGGDHEVVLEFRPLSLQVGTLISACGLGLMLCTFYLRRRKHRPENKV